MRYRVRHETSFDYPAPVRFARCNLRLKPIDWDGQRLIAHAIETHPSGRLSAARGDSELVNTTRLVVEEDVRALTIVSHATVDVDRSIPMPSPDDPDLAAVAAEARASRDATAAGPACHLFASPMIMLDPAIADWCAQSLRADRGILDAAYDLATRIQRDFTYDPDATFTETPPAESFARRAGVCQDFAQVMISGLRSFGLPAAYVSGYLRTLPPPGEARLVGADATHAWVLVWTGARRGWVGVDPTNGIWMAGDHIVTAIGRDYSDVAPIDGIFLGAGARAMRVGVDVEPLIDAAYAPS